jgi:hypothetical protein
MATDAKNQKKQNKIKFSYHNQYDQLKGTFFLKTFKLIKFLRHK